MAPHRDIQLRRPSARTRQLRKPVVVTVLIPRQGCNIDAERSLLAHPSFPVVSRFDAISMASKLP